MNALNGAVRRWSMRAFFLFFKLGGDIINSIPLNVKDDGHEDSAHAAAAQPMLEWPYHPADQKLFSFS